MVYMGFWKGDPRWKREQKTLAENVMSVEPFVESVPQALWMSFLWLSTACVGPVVSDGETRSIQPLGLLTYASSIMSASYSLANFLRVGPFKVIQNQSFCHPSFPLLFCSNVFSLITKGCFIGFIFAEGNAIRHLKHDQTFPFVQEIALLSIFIPQLLLGVVSIMATDGPKDSFMLAIRHSALLLMPVYTPFTFGPVNSCLRPGQTRKIWLHLGLTCINLVITTAVILVVGYMGGGFEGPWWVLRTSSLHLFPYTLLSHLLTFITTVAFSMTSLCSCCCLGCNTNRKKSRTVNKLLTYPESNTNIEMNNKTAGSHS